MSTSLKSIIVYRKENDYPTTEKELNKDIKPSVNPIAHRLAKTELSFGHKAHSASKRAKPPGKNVSKGQIDED